MLANFSVLLNLTCRLHTHTQLYLSFRPLESTCEAEALDAMDKCIADVRSWTINYKTEFLVIGMSKQLSKVSVGSIKVGDVDVIPVHKAKKIWASGLTHMDMARHFTKTCGSAFFYLYNIQHVWKYLTRECTEKLIHAFITSRLDYCNSLLYGVPDHHMQKLQRVMNASARLIFCAPKHCHITPLLQQLHWLPIRLRIEFKILLITFKVLQGSAPKYLIDLISVLPPSRYDLRRNDKGILLSTSKRFTKVTMGDRSFMAAAPRLWNSLPVSIRSACTKSDFKQKLKTFLFSKAFC